MANGQDLRDREGKRNLTQRNARGGNDCSTCCCVHLYQAFKIILAQHGAGPPLISGSWIFGRDMIKPFGRDAGASLVRIESTRVDRGWLLLSPPLSKRCARLALIARSWLGVLLRSQGEESRAVAVARLWQSSITGAVAARSLALTTVTLESIIPWTDALELLRRRCSPASTLVASGGRGRVGTSDGGVGGEDEYLGSSRSQAVALHIL